MRPPSGSLASAAMALSIAAVSRTVARINLTAKDGAAASSAGKKIEWGAVSGLKMIATRLMLGEICFNNCSHFPATAGSRLLKPVMLPPGFERLVTKPSPIGSETTAKTIGIVRVSRTRADSSHVDA